MAFVRLQVRLKYGGNGPIASPGKAVPNSRKTHRAETPAIYGERALLTRHGLAGKNRENQDE